MKISVILPTYNKLPRLKLVLASLEMQTYHKNDFEVVLIDDGSCDRTFEYVNSNNIDVDLRVFRIENSGRAAARNYGIEKSKYEILLFIDDDTILSPDFVKYHAESQKKEMKVNHGRIINLGQYQYFEDPTKGIIFTDVNISELVLKRIRKFKLTEEDVKYYFHEKIGKFHSISSFEEIIENVLVEGKSHLRWIGFTGGNISIPKKWMDDIGRFDEKFGKCWGCEDLESGYRVSKNGHIFSYDYKAVNYHVDHYRKTSAEEHGENSKYFEEKHNCQEIFYIQKYIEKKITKSELKKLCGV